MDRINDVERLKKLRKEIFLMAYSGNTGHLASAFSIIEVFYTLYFKDILRYNPKEPQWNGRDKLIVSKGHSSLALYAVLGEAGYFPKDQMFHFCRPGSLFGGEPKLGDIPGVEASTGSLGHGLSYGLGMAMANKMDKNDSRIFVVIGDGECQEGSVWEAVIAAKKFELNNLTVILDSNKMQAMGSINEIMGMDSWRSKWESFGWIVDTVDGHNVEKITQCLKKENNSTAPRVIIADTVKGKGVSFMESVPIWHFRMPNAEELKIVMRELNISKKELEECEMHI